MNTTGLQSADKPHAIIEPWAFIEANWRPKSLTNKLTDDRNPLATIKTALKFRRRTPLPYLLVFLVPKISWFPHKLILKGLLYKLLANHRVRIDFSLFDKLILVLSRSK